jgi:histidinol-phosphate aminotransferase
MAIDYRTLATTGVQGLHPYQPGKPIDELARELGLDPANIVKLASNENPLGPSEKALAAIQAALPELCRYPDGNGFALKEKLAARYGLETAQITLGNGSNDILELAARAFVDGSGEIVYSEHAFAVYPIVTQALGAGHVKVPAKAWGHDLDAMAAAVTERTRLVFIANPNNPTGTMAGREALRHFLRRLPETVIVVLDEAYCEYMDTDDYPDGLEFLAEYPNLIVARTFSKAWGLAALRVGYALSSPGIADVLNRVRQPFNVDALALAAASAVLDDEDYLERSKAENRRGLQQLAGGLEKLGLSWIPTQCNFVAVDMGQPAQPIYEVLLQEGIIVRPVAAYGMPNHLRISVGLEHENRRCLDALERILNRKR